MGAYGTRNDVVATALEVLKTQELLRKAHRVELKEEIQTGIDQWRRGETADFTAEDITRLGREHLAKQAGRYYMPRIIKSRQSSEDYLEI